MKNVACKTTWWRIAVILHSSFFILHSLLAAEPTTAQLEFFENKIRPVLSQNCYKCHSVNSEKVKGGLLLDSREAMLRGGDNGPAVVPSHPDKSLLIQAVRYTDADLQMPPKKQLTDEQIADLEAWVKMGSPDPRAATAAQKSWIDPNQKHWAWQPLRKPAVSSIDELIGVLQRSVDEITNEINLVWSTLELPWYKRMRKLRRSWAVTRAQKVAENGV